MKVRFFRVISVLSVLWLGLIIYGAVFGTAKGQLLLNLIVLGWPALLGLLASFVATGSLWPKHRESDT
jgi:hypothetical protein